jgi:hypothetical protein
VEYLPVPGRFATINILTVSRAETNEVCALVSKPGARKKTIRIRRRVTGIIRIVQQI